MMLIIDKNANAGYLIDEMTIAPSRRDLELDNENKSSDFTN